ncbi:MAG: hypothetical protein NT150_04195 [Bacteroidetes bacterium]|nr:hypothetical protein [Bacteroidota bacterium]
MNITCIINKCFSSFLVIASFFFLLSCDEQNKEESVAPHPVVHVDSIQSASSDLLVDTVKKESDPEKKTIGDDAPEELLEEGEITGTFLNMEWGDYLHFNMKKLNGDTATFFVLDFSGNRRLLRSMEVNPSYQGKKIKVKWARVKVNLEGGGRKSSAEKLVDVEEMK